MLTQRADDYSEIQRLETLSTSPDDWNRVIVLANRAPVRHERAADGDLRVTRSASGLVTALEPIVAGCSGTWVAHETGNADCVMVDERNGHEVPFGNERYRLRYVRLTAEEHRGYYYGFANEGLWPLCHAVHVQPAFRMTDFSAYRAANMRFSLAVADEAAGTRSLVLVQDYHFALAPRMVRRLLHSSTIVHFWHIPWPDPRAFTQIPCAAELLEGMLGSDIVGLQTSDDCANFLGSVQSVLDATVDWSSGQVTYGSHRTLVRAYPVGIEWDNCVSRDAPSPGVCRERVYRDLGLAAHVDLAVGIDRLDYTKGINEKFLAVERMLETHADLRGRFVFAQVAEPSRDCLPAYRDTRAQLAATRDRVNARFGAGSYSPIVLLEAHHEPDDVYRLYRAATACYVGSLRDGMNLVAKEFVCARDDNRGVLLLSEYAGAAQQLRAALLVNPYRLDECADALWRSLRMPEMEQVKRMKLLRANVEAFDSRWWTHQLFTDAGNVHTPTPFPFLLPPQDGDSGRSLRR
jgi:trehalose 6-phosphate synthase